MVTHGLFFMLAITNVILLIELAGINDALHRIANKEVIEDVEEETH